MNCIECGLLLNSNNTKYKAYDQTICSKHCMHNLAHKINCIDPKLSYPHFWSNYKELYIDYLSKNNTNKDCQKKTPELNSQEKKGTINKNKNNIYSPAESNYSSYSSYLSYFCDTVNWLKESIIIYPLLNDDLSKYSIYLFPSHEYLFPMK